MSNTKFILEKDGAGRLARYLRISITDRCNFNCLYCRDSRRHEYIPHQNILRYEEILRFAKILKNMGIGKIRITGGEPFARKNCAPFLLDLRDAFPDVKLSVTTNGSLLEPWLSDLARISPESINISLDSFNRDSFLKITGQDSLNKVLRNIERLLLAGIRVKLNAVALRGVTDRELDDFIYTVRKEPMDIRFIEFMPMGASTRWAPEMFLPAGELKNMFMEKVQLEEEPRADPLAGPARMHKIKGAKGKLGFISAISDHFCKLCNRLRLTSDGKLRTCLFSDKEYEIAPFLRNPQISDQMIAKAVADANAIKPLGEDILRNKKNKAVADKEMYGIGG